jgi:hypothetical protein
MKKLFFGLIVLVATQAYSARIIDTVDYIQAPEEQYLSDKIKLTVTKELKIRLNSSGNGELRSKNEFCEIQTSSSKSGVLILEKDEVLFTSAKNNNKDLSVLNSDVLHIRCKQTEKVQSYSCSKQVLAMRGVSGERWERYMETVRGSSFMGCLFKKMKPVKSTSTTTKSITSISKISNLLKKYGIQLIFD